MKKILFSLLLFASAISFGQASFQEILADSAASLKNSSIIYDSSYYSIPYPNGDLPANKGVCTDVIIRAYRKMGIDLQREVHEDMKANFSKYPKIWGLRSTDRNIDHRRVPNLMTFFERQGTVKAITQNSKDYKPGDIVCWRLSNGMTHIGIVTKKKSRWDSKRYMLMHNIGAGQVEEDCLFSYKIIGHYSYVKR